MTKHRHRSQPVQIPRPLARAPIAIFRLGLGGVFGGHLLMLDHRGRRTGAIRHVVLETVAREGPTHLVVSGYGRKSQWLRNITADPRVRLWSGWGRGRSARAEILTPTEGRAVLEDYRRRHPKRARALTSLLNVGALAPDEPLPTDAGERLPVVRIQPVETRHRPRP